MKAKKVFKNNSSIYNEYILYYHGWVRIVGDKKFTQGKIVQVPIPRMGLNLFIIEYNIKHVSDLEAYNLKISSFLKGSGNKIEGSIFHSR